MRIVNRILPFLLFAACCMPVRAQQRETYSVAGRVIDRLTRQPVPYASVVVAGDERKGASSDSTGRFVIERVPPGVCRFAASSVGYKSLLTSEYLVSAATPFVEIELEEDATRVEAVTVRPSPFRATVESPVGLNVIGIREIEKSPGSNRDISRIVRSYPGVAFSPVGYRNDLIVRGGGPSENKFFMDGIEIPNINHFATQGATGGPVSIVNADLIQEISFYTGAFPADRAGALSSVLDFRLRDGNAEKQTFKATLGASDAGVSGSGHIGGRTTYVFSLRQSYLQLLFKMLGLPFLPNYIDGQVKVKTRLTERDELTVLALAGIDNMKLNVDEKGEDAEYLLSYLPRIRQETFTVGASWRHYAGRHVQTVTLSHNYLNNRNLKYRNNDASSEENLTLRLRSVEQKTSLRAENRTYAGRWTLRGGVELNYSHYTNRTLQRLYAGGVRLSNYRTRLGIVGWGLFAGADYASALHRLGGPAGRRVRLLRAHGPAVAPAFAARLGIVCRRSRLDGERQRGALLPAAALYGAGVQGGGRLREPGPALYARGRGERGGFVAAARPVEGFWKGYGDVPLSLADGIPLSCKGNDYGVVGNEALRSSAEGRAYGVEAMARWQIPGRVNVVGSVTLFRSEYRSDGASPWVASAWDNRFVANVSGTYDLPRGWSVGAKLSAVGGAPYTPYDLDKSSLVEAWNAQGRPYYDYSRYNEGRLDAFAQLDLRIDKVFYFRGCMLGLYIDLQNVTVSKLRQPDVAMSTGEIVNPEAPASEQRYRMKFLRQESGTLLPSIGVTVEF